MVKEYDVTEAIISYEQNDLDKDEVLELFQYLVSSGLAWRLQGSYGRTAKTLLDAGHIQWPNTGAAGVY